MWVNRAHRLVAAPLPCSRRLAGALASALLASSALASGSAWLQAPPRTPPATLPDLGKGQRPAGLAPQRYAADGRPLPALPVSTSTAEPLEAPPARHRVTQMVELRDALARVRAGEVIELAPGRYRWTRQLSTQSGGRPGEPIVLRARQSGTVHVDVDAQAALAIVHPYWLIENLTLQGVCAPAADCEHAFHVMGGAVGTVIRNNRLLDFNAHIKVNGLRGEWPDHGLAQHNSLLNRQARPIERPVTPFDLVGASHWLVRDNEVRHVHRPDARATSYGLYMKGGGEGGRIEHNLVICSERDIDVPGARIGISLGGGLTGTPYARSLEHEHRGGVVQFNVVAHCNDTGLDANRAVDGLFADNLLINTAGISLRGGAQARLLRNRLDGRIRERQGSRAEQEGNQIGDSRRWFVDADALDLRQATASR